MIKKSFWSYKNILGVLSSDYNSSPIINPSFWNFKVGANLLKKFLLFYMNLVAQFDLLIVLKNDLFDQGQLSWTSENIRDFI